MSTAANVAMVVEAISARPTMSEIVDLVNGQWANETYRAFMYRSVALEVRVSASGLPIPAHPAPGSIASKYIARHGRQQYISRYNAGWRTSQTAPGLDAADGDGRSSDDAWMDGYLDYASRSYEKWHAMCCFAHQNDTPDGCGRA